MLRPITLLVFLWVAATITSGALIACGSAPSPDPGAAADVTPAGHKADPFAFAGKSDIDVAESALYSPLVPGQWEFQGWNAPLHVFEADSSGLYRPYHQMACAHTGTAFYEANQRRVVMGTDWTGMTRDLDEYSTAPGGTSLKCQARMPVQGSFTDAKGTVGALFAPLVSPGAWGLANNGAGYMDCLYSSSENRDNTVQPAMNIAIVQTSDMAHWVQRTVYTDTSGCLHSVTARYTQKS